MSERPGVDVDELAQLLAEAVDAWNERKANGQETSSDYLKAHANLTLAVQKQLP
jgi:hypothetical protein